MSSAPVVIDGIWAVSGSSRRPAINSIFLITTTTLNLSVIIIIYNDLLLTPRRGSLVKSDKTHTQPSRYTP